MAGAGALGTQGGRAHAWSIHLRCNGLGAQKMWSIHLRAMCHSARSACSKVSAGWARSRRAGQGLGKVNLGLSATLTDSGSFHPHADALDWSPTIES